MALAIGCGGKKREPAPEPPTLTARIDASLARARGFLLTAQKPDGSWRSGSYAAFRDGYSLSPLVLAALFALPDAGDAYRRGVDYLATMVVDGAMRDDVDAPRYPQYSMALGTVVLNLPGNERHSQARGVMIDALRARQLDSGGWGYGEPAPGGAANLSATLFAVGALRLAGVGADDPALVRALGFVDRCRGADGGFHFSPDLADGNKAGADDSGAYRSYGSMTADGVRALVRLDVPPSDPRVAGARAWLEAYFDPAANPGDFPDVAEIRRASSYYYYAWSVAHAMRHLGVAPARWAEPLAEALLARQAPDGSFANSASEMREDDPLVATSFAVAALAIARMVVAGPHRSHAATARPAPAR